MKNDTVFINTERIRGYGYDNHKMVDLICSNIIVGKGLLARFAFISNTDIDPCLNIV